MRRYYLQLQSQPSSLLSLKFAGPRDVAQLVEYTSGGREVAGSSPVIPTSKKHPLAGAFLILE